ncbi:TPA: DUF1493 family protein [Salmonella enterica]|nr:DUF1493 family protein [Salmonella enterica subsp. enterica serovar Onderstepoort]HAU3016489.1 DUF1493 family protein [Salmonella enterica]
MTTETGVNNSPTLIKRDVTTEVSLIGMLIASARSGRWLYD